MCRKINFIKPVGKRNGGRPPLMWEDSTEQDIQILVIKAWKTIVEELR